MTLTSEQIEILKKAAGAMLPPDEVNRLRADMQVLHEQVVSAILPQLATIVLFAQMDISNRRPMSEVLMQMYTSGFAMGLVFAETQELEKLRRL